MSDEAGRPPDIPGVIAPPPLIYAVALVAGLLLNRRYPIPFLPRAVNKVVGASLVGGGLLTGGWAIYTIRRAGSNENPYKPSTTIVDEGPYQYTRNPMYVGFTLLHVGISALANALPPLLLLPGVWAVMQRGVIEREERYLESKFGDEYRAYKARVRRWI